MKNKDQRCLYGLEECYNYRSGSKPFCSNHYQQLVEIAFGNEDNFQPDYQQDGGNILGAISKIGRLAQQNKGKLTKVTDIFDRTMSTIDQGMSKIDQGINAFDQISNKASALTNQASQLTSQIQGITGQITNITPFDSNYGQNALIANSPLGSQGNFQSFGDFVCIRKSFLSDLRTLIFELLANREDVI